MREFLERLAERQAAAQAEADDLREQIAELTQRLNAAEQVLSRLRVTRETILEMTGESGETAAGPPTLTPVYRQILAVVEQAPDGLRVKDICRLLNTGTDHTHTESLRAKLKRMVARGVLTEPEPGLFILPRPGHDA
jgi:cell division septum initiation protein DivIVA